MWIEPHRLNDPERLWEAAIPHDCRPSLAGTDSPGGRVLVLDRKLDSPRDPASSHQSSVHLLPLRGPRLPTTSLSRPNNREAHYHIVSTMITFRINTSSCFKDYFKITQQTVSCPFANAVAALRKPQDDQWNVPMRIGTQIVSVDHPARASPATL